MKLKIYNTMSHEKEEFVPLMDEGKKDFVGIYSCGPTVYRNPHIGNMRAYVFADTLGRTIRNILGYPTKHVMNLTDVGHLTDDGDEGEDKMEKGAKRENKTVWELADMYIAKFYEYLDAVFYFQDLWYFTSKICGIFVKFKRIRKDKSFPYMFFYFFASYDL